jgi:hypothetical protein
MTTKDDALKLGAAFDKRFTSMNGVDVPERVSVPRDEWRALHAALKQALAAPVQEPDAMGCKCSICGEWQRWTPSGMACKNGHGGARGINHRLYTTPPAAQRQFVGLTDGQIESLWDHGMYVHCSGITALRAITRAIEAKLKEKNT